MKNEVVTLKLAIEKYDGLLKEYQTKCGDEIFKNLDEFVQNENKLDVKLLIENVGLFREYEKNLLEKDNNIEYLNEQLNELQGHLHSTIEENEDIRLKLETKEEYFIIYFRELNKFYKLHLNPENNNYSKSSLLGIGGNKNEDINKQIEILNNNNELLLKSLESTKVELEQKKFYMTEFKEKYTKISVDYEQINELYHKYKHDFEELYRTKNDFEKRIHSNVESMINLEKELNKVNSKYFVIMTEKEYNERELDHYKEYIL